MAKKPRLTEKEKLTEIMKKINEVGPSPELLLVVAMKCIKAVGIKQFKEFFSAMRPDLAAEMEMAVKVVKNRN